MNRPVDQSFEALQVIEQASESESRFQRAKQACVFFGTAAFASLSLLISPVSDSAPEASPVAAPAVEPGPDCPTPSQESIQAIEDALENDNGSSLPRPSHISNKQRIHDQNSKEITKLDVDMPVDPDQPRGFMLQTALDDREPKQPFDAYLSYAQDVLDQFDITIRVGVPEGVNAKKPTVPELESDDAKFQVMQLVELFLNNPSAMTDDWELKEIALTAHTIMSGDNGSYGVAGQALPNRHMMIIDVVNAGQDETVAAHELKHFDDDVICEGHRDDDPGFIDLNIKATYANQWPAPDNFIDSQPASLSEVTHSSTYESLGEIMLDAEVANNPEKYCYAKAARTALREDVEMIDEYSSGFPSEDKANVGAAIFDPWAYGPMLEQTSHVIRIKFIYLLAQQYEEHPNEVRYLIHEAHLGDQSLVDCNELALSHSS